MFGRGFLYFEKNYWFIVKELFIGNIERGTVINYKHRKTNLATYQLKNKFKTKRTVIKHENILVTLSCIFFLIDYVYS